MCVSATVPKIISTELCVIFCMRCNGAMLGHPCPFYSIFLCIDLAAPHFFFFRLSCNTFRTWFRVTYVCHGMLCRLYGGNEFERNLCRSNTQWIAWKRLTEAATPRENGKHIADGNDAERSRFFFRLLVSFVVRTGLCRLHMKSARTMGATSRGQGEKKREGGEKEEEESERNSNTEQNVFGKYMLRPFPFSRTHMRRLPMHSAAYGIGGFVSFSLILSSSPSRFFSRYFLLYRLQFLLSLLAPWLLYHSV